MAKDGGFYNHRTGKYVSGERAHQHVGESFGGYEKALSRSTGNYYMRPSPSNYLSSYNPFLEIQAAQLEAQVSRMYADSYVAALQSLAARLEQMTRKMEEDRADQLITDTYNRALNYIASYEEISKLDSNAIAEGTLSFCAPDELQTLFRNASNLEELRSNCKLVLRVMKKGEELQDDSRWKMNSTIEDEETKERARETYSKLSTIRAARRTAFEAMKNHPVESAEHSEAALTFWQTIDAEYAIVDPNGWKAEKYAEAHSLLEGGSASLAAGILESLDNYSDSKTLLHEARSRMAYEDALNKLEAGKFFEAEQAFVALGNWGDAPQMALKSGECRKAWQYRKAARLRKSKKFDQAIKLYEQLSGYKDSDDLLKATLIEQEKERAWCEREEELRQQRILSSGKNCLEREDFDGALSFFTSISSNQDAKRLIKETKRARKLHDAYEEAERHARLQHFDTAAASFKRLGDYKDSAKRAEENLRLFNEYQMSAYEAALKALDDGRYDEAISGFTALGDYRSAPKNLALALMKQNQEKAFEKARAYYRTGSLDDAKTCLEHEPGVSHPQAKAMLSDIATLNELQSELLKQQEERASLLERVTKTKTKRDDLVAERAKPVEVQVEIEAVKDKLTKLSSEYEKLGLFAFKKKRAAIAAIAETEAEIQLLALKVPAEIEQRNNRVNAAISGLDSLIADLHKKIDQANSYISRGREEIERRVHLYDK